MFNGFTGLMYAVYTDNIQAVKLLLADEGMITTTSKNIIFAKKNKNVVKFLTNRGLDIANLIFLSGAVVTFFNIYNFETEMQGLEDEKEQFKLNAVCKHIKDQMHQYQAMFVYHQMLFDIGES